jgi:hypothetical protein
MWGQHLTSALIGFGVASLFYILPRLIKLIKDKQRELIIQIVNDYLKELQNDNTTSSKEKAKEN